MNTGAMSEPLDLEPIKARDAAYWDLTPGTREHDRRLLLAEVERLRAEVARRDEQIAAVQVVMDEWRNVGDPIYMHDAANEIDAALDGAS